MKRYIAIILAVLLAVSMMGCGQSGDLFTESTGEEGAVQTAPVDEKGMKVGYLLPSGTDTTDTESRIEGIRQMQYETGLKDSQILIRTDVSKDDSAAAIDEMVRQGCNIIFACDGRYENTMLAAAQQHPDVQFCQEDGTKAKKSGLANMHTYYVRLFEGYYAAGVISGMKINELLNSGRITSADCIIGFVANAEEPETTSCINAFYLGVGEVCSQASMLVRYTEGAGDYDADARAAQQLLEAGASFMSQFTSTTGVATICAENDIPIVGNAVNIIDVAPSEALTSVVADWSVYYTYAVNCLLQGTAIDTDWSGGYDDGAVILSQLNDKHLAEGSIERLTEVEKDLRDGKAKVFDTEKFTVDGDSLETLAEDNDDFKKFAKNIKDGEYRESAKRSAPSMDFFVDGIEESTYDYLGDGEENAETDEADSDSDEAAVVNETVDEENTDEEDTSDEDAANEGDSDEDTTEEDDSDADTSDADDEESTSDEESDTEEDTEEESDTETRGAAGRYNFAEDSEE